MVSMVTQIDNNMDRKKSGKVFPRHASHAWLGAKIISQLSSTKIWQLSKQSSKTFWVNFVYFFIIKVSTSLASSESCSYFYFIELKCESNMKT